MIYADIQISKDFKFSELLSSQTARVRNIREQFCPPLYVVQNLIYITTHYLQPLRDACGVVYITSGYRCNRLNNLVKGSCTSAHLFGFAVDFTVKDMDAAVSFLKSYNFDQLIVYDTFIHLGLHFLKERNQIISK